MSNQQVIQYSYGSPQKFPVANDSQKLIFVDPPYNLGVRYADDPTGDLKPESAYRDWCDGVAHCLSLKLDLGGTIWWLCPAEHFWIGDILRRRVGPQQYLIIKEESFSQYNRADLTCDYRLLFVHGRGLRCRPNVDAIRIPSQRLEQGDSRADPRGRVPGQIWKVRRLQGSSLDRHTSADGSSHKCQLPPELFDRIIKGWTNPGDNVLDAFAGTGCMGLRAKILDRNYIGVDQSPTYCAELRKRLEIV